MNLQQMKFVVGETAKHIELEASEFFFLTFETALEKYVKQIWENIKFFWGEVFLYYFFLSFSDINQLYFRSLYLFRPGTLLFEFYQM